MNKSQIEGIKKPPDYRVVLRRFGLAVEFNLTLDVVPFNPKNNNIMTSACKVGVLRVLFA